MDTYNLDKYYFRSNSICCELVGKTKQYINILQFESNRLSSLQTECNQLLDRFYALKDEFDFLIKEALLVKYFANDDNLFIEEYIKEFTMFAMNVWQIGKHKFSEKGKKAQYMCFVGKLLSEVTATIHSFVDEVMPRLNYMPFHTECTATMHTICNQIYAELQGDCLGSANACLRQYVYLQAATPFLQELNGLINQYLLRPDIHTPKQFLNRVILQIPPIEKLFLKEDTEDTSPFRYVVNLLNGKLLDNEVLDQNSDIKPIVEDDINLKRSNIVIKTVEWIMLQYRVQDIPMLAKNHIALSTDTNEKKKTRFTEEVVGNFSLHQTSLVSSYQAQVDVSDVFEPFDLNKIDWSGIYNSPTFSQRKYSRRGRKNGSTNFGSRTSNDLQPIKLHTLQTPLLPPLL